VHRRWIGVSDHAIRLTTATFGLQPAESTTIYCPIDVSHPTAVIPSDLPARFVLFAGAVGARKGAYAVAAAARLFLPLYPDLHLVYLGELLVEDGKSADVRIHEIVGPDLSARVHCLGRLARADMLGCMARAVALLFPSRLETFGLVVAEAMLLGVPVVTSTCDPFPEYIAHQQTGLLVPPDDAPALSAAVRSLLDSPDWASRLATAAQREVAGRFSIQTCIERSEQFYRRGSRRGQGDVSSSGATRSRATVSTMTGDTSETP
jgi:glycosyltransferase involved in cell wall biosynthesis